MDSGMLVKIEDNPGVWRVYALPGFGQFDTYCFAIGNHVRTLHRAQGESAAAFHRRMLEQFVHIRVSFGRFGYAAPLGIIVAWRGEMKQETLRRLADVEVAAAALGDGCEQDTVKRQLFEIADPLSGATHRERVAALCKLADILDMNAPQRVEATVAHVMQVPPVATVDDWERRALAHQAALRSASGIDHTGD